MNRSRQLHWLLIIGMGAFALIWPFGNIKDRDDALLSRKETLYRRVGALLGWVLLAAMLAACGSQRTEGSAAGAPAAASGSELFERLDCIQCHQMDGSGPGPSLAGLYGETIPLENGETVTVDDQYIRTSILDPRAHTHADYLPIMPSYGGRIGEEELSMLVEYIQSLEE